MNKSIIEVRKQFIDSIFKLVGFDSMEDAMNNAEKHNYEFPHSYRDKITTKLKKEKVKKCHIETVQDVLSGYVLEDVSKMLSLEPKFIKKMVSPEEFAETGIPYISHDRDWISYEYFQKNDLISRCEKFEK